MLVITALACGVILPFVLIHVDDPDAMLYTVVARNLAVDADPFRLRFLDAYWPQFYEHPPLFFAIQALSVRALGPASLAWLGALIGAGTLLTTYRFGVELVGRRAAFMASAILALTESFFRYQGRARLDPPLTLIFLGSVACIVLARMRPAWLCVGGALAGAGALIKGPPAFGAPIAAALVVAALGRGDELRRVRDWLLVAVSMLALPAAFLIYDHIALEGVWWKGYVEGQVLASITGRRVDGWTDRGYLARDLFGRFYPGLPLVTIALAAPLIARRWPQLIRVGAASVRARIGLLAWAALIVLGFSLGRRAWWVYAMPAYVPLALLAGAGADDLVTRVGGARAFRIVRRTVVIGAAILVALLPFRLARFVVQPCPFAEIPERVVALTGGRERVALVMPVFDLGMLAYLAEHSGREIEPLDGSRVAGLDPQIRVAVFSEAAWPADRWIEISRNRAWILARRAQPQGAGAESSGGAGS